MTRPLPIRANQLPMAVLATFDPNGAHQMKIDLGTSGVMDLTADEARRLRRALDVFELEAMRIDGHTNLTNRVTKLLGEF